MQAALDPTVPAERVFLRTLVEHTGRVFRLQFDDFQIVSSSHDDSIIIWDFMNPTPETVPLNYPNIVNIKNTALFDDLARQAFMDRQENQRQDAIMALLAGQDRPDGEAADFG